MIITGEYHNGVDTRKNPATLILGNGGNFKLIWEDGEQAGSLAAAKISARLGNIPRHIRLDNEAEFTTPDNDAVDRAIAAAGIRRNPSFAYKLEHNPLIAATALILLTVLVTWFFKSGVPALSERAVALIPPEFDRSVGQRSIETLDRFAFSETKLDADFRHRISTEFSELLRAQGYKQNIVLLFRDGGRIGPNAFALPGGTIVVTDQLVRLAEDPREIMAVLGHELGHIVNKHGMRRIVENSAVTLVMFTLTNDANTMMQAAAAFPVMLINSKYSRAYETEADRYGLDFLQRAGISPEYYANILRRLEEFSHGSNTPGFLSSHPATVERIKLVEDMEGGQPR
jgi:predicted Zn-dependent protease